MRTRFIILLCFLGAASLSAAYTATDSCTGTTSCSLVGAHAATDVVIIWAYRAASATAPTLGSGTNITNGSSATGASRSWRAGCLIAGTTGSVSTGTWTNATNVVAFAISGTGATTTGNCVTNGIGTVGTANSVSSATATYSALTMSASPTATSIPLLVMGSSTSGQTCTPTGATAIASTGDVRASLANATGNWSSTTCAITSSVTTEIVIELKAALVATPSFSPNGGTFGGSASETLSDTTGGASICYTTDGSTPAAATAGTCSAGSTYSSPFSVATNGATLKALGTAATLANSAVATSSAFTINPFLPNLASMGVSGPQATVPITYAGITCHNETTAALTISCSASMVIPANTAVVIGCDWGAGAGVTVTGSDDAANSYVPLGTVTSSSVSANLFAFYYSAGQTRTPKCTYSATTGTFRDITAAGYADVASASFQDASGLTGTGSGTSATTSAITATQCGDVFVEYAAFAGAATDSVSAPFTMRQAPSGNGNGLADFISTTTAAQAGAMTGPSASWAIVIAALKAATGC